MNRKIHIFEADQPVLESQLEMDRMIADSSNQSFLEWYFLLPSRK